MVNKLPNNPDYEEQLKDDSSLSALPYEYVILDIDEKRSEQKKNEFRGELTNLSDAQLFILKQIAIEEKNSEAIKIIEEERPGDLSKALEWLSLQQRYELAKSTVMPEAFCPEWVDGVYAALIDIEKISDEKTKTKKTQIFLSRLTSEELNTFASMLESYMRDIDTAKLLRQEYKRRKELEDKRK